MTTDIRTRISLDGVAQVRAGAQQAAQSLSRVGDAADLTSRQARLLGRSFGDAVRAIGGSAGGPLGEAAQRVSQLGIAFGGLDGVSTRITPLVGVVGGLAAAVGVLAVAYKQGKAETDGYAKALILSGNAVGATVGQLNELAKAQAAIAGSQGKAAEVLTQLAASGNVAAGELGKAAGAAIRFERAGGAAADETAKKFIELGKDPLKGLIKLNEAENFLTRSVYETVKALEAQGKRAEAATVAQNAYADAVSGRSAQLEPRLGTLQRAWQGVADQAKRAWNAMLNIGREDTLEEKLEQTRAKIETQRRRLAGLESAPQAGNPGLTGGSGAASARASIQSLRDRESMQQSDLRLFRQAAERQRQNAAAIKAQIEADAKPRGSGGGESPYAALIGDLRKLEQTQEEELRTGGKVSEARKLQIRLVEQFADKAQKLTFAQRQAVAAEIALRVAAQGRIDDLQKQVKAEQDYAEAEAKAIQQQYDSIARQAEARQKELAGIDERAQAISDEISAADMAKAANISLAEAIESLAIARLREKAAAATGDPGRLKDINDEIAARERLLGTLAAKAAREGAEKSAKELEDAYLKSYDTLSQGLVDALIQGGKSAADYIKGLFRTMVLRPLLEPFVRPVAGVLAGATSGSSAFAAAIGGDSGGQSLFGTAAQGASLFNAGKAIYAGFQSGFAGVGAFAQNTAVQAGLAQYGGYSTNAALIEAQAGAQGYGAAAGTVGANGAGSASMFGSAAQSAAGVAVGVYGGRAISGGYSAIGNSGNAAVNVGTVIGEAIGLWLGVPGVGGAIGGAIGGVVNRVFGRKAPEVEARSIEGSISGTNFTGSTVQDIVEKGGLFRSDKRYSESQAITGDLDKALDEGAKSLSDLAGKYGAALGLPAEQLAGVTAQIKVKITDDAAENSKAITDALQQYADALLGTFADDVEPFRKSGETVAQTIERVGGALLTVNDSLELLGVQALATSVDGGQAAIALADLFGDAGTFAQAAGSYYSKFYSEAERADRATQQITETLAQFGLQAPATRDDFRALVEAQDLTTKSGREAFAALLGVSDAFDALQTAAGDTAQALAEVVQQRKDLETQLLGLQGNTTELRARERAALDESNRALYDQIKALEDQKDAAEEVAKAAEEAAKAADDLANRLRNIQSGADAIVGDFLSGNDLARNRATRINEILTEGGITGGTVEGIIGSTREDIANLWNSVGTAGREAILEAYGLWKDLDELVRGTSRAVADYRGGTLADSIEGARLGSLSPAARLAELRRLEGEGFAGLAGAADPVAAAQKLANIVSQRVALEAQLEDNRGEALRAELQAVERIRDVAQDALQAAAQMRFDDNSSLSARDQLGAARSLFESTVARARAGDQNALGSLIGNAQAFRQEARTALASSPAYAAIDALVTGTLEQFGLAGAGAAGRATELQKQIDALAGIDASLGENGALNKALQRIDTTLASAFGSAAVAPTTGTVTMTGTNGLLTGISETGSSLAVLPPVGAPVNARTEELLQQVLAQLQLLVSRADAGLTLEQADTQQLVDGLKAIETPLVDIARQARLGSREANLARA